MGSSVTIRVDKQQKTSMQFQPSAIWNGAPKVNDYGTDPFVCLINWSITALSCEACHPHDPLSEMA